MKFTKKEQLHWFKVEASRQADMETLFLAEASFPLQDLVAGTVQVMKYIELMYYDLIDGDATSLTVWAECSENPNETTFGYDDMGYKNPLIQVWSDAYEDFTPVKDLEQTVATGVTVDYGLQQAILQAIRAWLDEVYATRKEKEQRKNAAAN